MDVLVKTYRIKNGNIEGGKTIDEIPLLEVSQFGEVKKYLEEEATEFRMDSISLKTEFLPKGFFDDYTPQTPYLVEVQVGSGWDDVDSRCVFYGPIKKKSIKYNERTGVTSFEVSSWERSIKQAGSVVARDRIPLKIAEPYQRGSLESDQAASTSLAVVGTDPDIPDVIEPGAVVATSGEAGNAKIDFRLIATDTPTQDGTADGEPVYKFPVVSGADDRINLGPVRGLDIRWYFIDTRGMGDYTLGGTYRWEKTRKQLGVPFGSITATTEGVVGARMTITNGTDSVERRVEHAYIGPVIDGPESELDDEKWVDNLTQNVDRGQYFWFVFDRPVHSALPEIEDAFGTFPETDPFPPTIDVEWSLSKRMRIERDEKATLYSADAYGVGGGQVEPYDPVNLSEGIATRIPALADLLDNSPLVRGEPGEISRIFEFEEKVIDALGDIQRSSESQVGFQARSRDGAGGERKDGGARRVKMVVTTRAYQVDQAAIDLPDAVEWKGEAIGSKPDVVLVEGPDPVNVSIERDTTYGWYPGGALDDPDRAGEGGQEVIKIEAPLLRSSVKGDSFGLPDNIPSLSGRARRYFDFYSQYYRLKEVVVDGVFDHVPGGDHEEPLLGSLVSEDESVMETGIVKAQSVNYQKEETKLEVLVAKGYTPPTNADPVAILRAPTWLGDENGDGTATVALDASSSFDPNGDPISVRWLKNGTEITGATDRFYEATVSDGDTITLEVSDPDGATDTDPKKFNVVSAGDHPGRGEEPYLKVQLNKSMSSDDERVYDVTAQKVGGVIKLTYGIAQNGSDVEVGEITGDDVFIQGQITVPTVLNNDRTLTVRASNLVDGAYAEERRIIEGIEWGPELLVAKVDPIHRGGGSVLAYADLNEDANSYDLWWRVEDESGELVDEDRHEDISPDGGSGAYQFYIASPPDGGSGWVKFRPQGSFGMTKALTFGDTKTILIGPPKANNTVFSIVGEAGGSTEASVTDPNSTLNITENVTEGGTEYQVSVPQKVGTSDSPTFQAVELGTTAKMGSDDSTGEMRFQDPSDNSFIPAHAKSINMESQGWGDVDESGHLYFNDTQGLYIKTPNASSSKVGGRLLWSGANFTAGDGMNVAFSADDAPTLSVASNVARTHVEESFASHVNLDSGYLWVKNNSLYVGGRGHIGGSSHPSETFRVSGDETVTGIQRVGSWAGVVDKMSVGASAPYGSNAPGTEQLQVNGSVGAYGYNFYGAGSWNIRSSGGTGDLLIHQNFGSKYSVLDIRTSDVDVTDTSANSEATLALVRTDSAENNVEFIDLYNNGYHTDNSVRYGLRVQKRGGGQLRRFAFEWSDGTNKPTGYNIYPPDDVTAGVDGALFDVYVRADFHRQITSGNYTSGILGTGYTLDPAATGGSFAEFDNMRIRNELRTHIFKKDIVRASNGYLLITDSAKVAEEKAIYQNGQTLKVESGNGNASFSTGDLLWLKNISNDGGTVNGVKVTVTSVDTSPSETDILTVDVQAAGDVYEGDTIVRVSGGYLLNDASSQYAPFIDVYDGVSSWADFRHPSKLKARYGNLEGVTHPTMSPTGYGLFSTNTYLEGEFVSGGGTNYIKANGDLYFADGKLTYNGTTLSVTGKVEADSGDIGGWSITSTALSKGFTNTSITAGTLPTANDYGFHLQSSTGRQVFMRVDEGEDQAEIGAYKDASNHVAIGEDFWGIMNGIGLRVRSAGTDVLQADEDGLKIDTLFTNKVFANEATITEKLTMGTNGQITNATSDYHIDSEGIAFNTGSGVLARALTWEESGTEIARIAADNGSYVQKVFGDENSGYSGQSLQAWELSTSTSAANWCEIAINYRPDGADSIQLNTSDTGGVYTSSSPRVEIGTVVGGNTDVMVQFHPNEKVMKFPNYRTSHYPFSALNQGEAVLYVLKKGDGDIDLIWREKTDDGTTYSSNLGS